MLQNLVADAPVVAGGLAAHGAVALLHVLPRHRRAEQLNLGLACSQLSHICTTVDWELELVLQWTVLPSMKLVRQPRRPGPGMARSES